MTSTSTLLTKVSWTPGFRVYLIVFGSIIRHKLSTEPHISCLICGFSDPMSFISRLTVSRHLKFFWFAWKICRS